MTVTSNENIAGLCSAAKKFDGEQLKIVAIMEKLSWQEHKQKENRTK